jgi:CRP-like cAMP-binding protein
MQAKEILKQHIAKEALLTDPEFDYFFSHFKLQSYKRGQTLITAGDKVECEYFVVDGCLKSFYINENMKMFNLVGIRL